LREEKGNIFFGQQNILEHCKNFKNKRDRKEYTWRQPWSSDAFGVRPFCPADAAQRSEFPHKSLGSTNGPEDRKKRLVLLWVELLLF
jgi:hypothetical protein